MFEFAATVQVYSIPFGTKSPPPSTGCTVNEDLEQIAAGVLLVIWIVGLTVMVTVNVLPTQLPAAPEVGVTV
jgi:hypothetical protein